MSVRTLGWLAVALMLAMALLPSAGARSAFAANLNPIEAANDCPDGLTGFKIDETADDLAEGTYSFNGFSVEIYDVVESDEGEVVSFSFRNASPLVAYVFAKGGQADGDYDYRPLGTAADEDLELDNGKGISHISFCYGQLQTPTPTPTPTPEPTPTPTPEPTPTPTPEPTPTPTPTAEALILVLKIVDEDGDLATEDDQFAAEGWEFELELEQGSIVDSVPVTGPDGIAGWIVSFEGDGTGATVTEVLQDGFELVDAFCEEIPLGDIEANSLDDATFTPTGNLSGNLEGDGISLDIENQTAYGCIFFNAPTPEDSVGGETGTPPTITLPPTDTFGATAAPAGEAWRMMLVLMAGILASLLILTPHRTSSRKR